MAFIMYDLEFLIKQNADAEPKSTTDNKVHYKVVVTFALTGSGPLSDNPNQPVTPQQIAQSGIETAEAR